MASQTFESYRTNDLIRSRVERKFEIIGEALNRLHRDAPNVLCGIREYRDIISFRNILIHGYDAIDDRIVWSVVEDDLDGLIEDVSRLIEEGKGGGGS